MPIALTEEQRGVQAAIRDWAARSHPIALTRRLEPGMPSSDRAEGGPGGVRGAAETETAADATGAERCWSDLAALGIFSIALPAEAGGAGGTITDLAAALEELARALAPGPILPTLLAGLILREAQDTPAAKGLLPALADGRAPVAVALAAGRLSGTWQPDGTLRVSGETGPVLGGGTTSHLLLGAATRDGETWFLATPGDPGLTLTERAPADFSRSLATFGLDGLAVAGERVLRGVSTGRVRDLAATLYAAEAAGVAGWCCETAAAYARTREQFGRPIGSFQAVKHLCAGMLGRAEQASVLAWDAARAADDARDQHPLVAATAAVALDLATDNAKDCIQVLGGIGFTWEHDAHLYLRRALALRQLLGGTAVWRARAAELALAGARRRLAVGPPGPAARKEAGAVTGTNGAAGDQTAAEARTLAARIASLPPERRRAELAEAGYIAPQWPRPYGRAASPAQQAVIDEEFHRAGLDRPDLVIGGWAVPAIIGHGTAEQASRFAGPTLRGEITWCQLFSEPEAGSDLAALRTRAVREDGGWRLTGQKVWTSLAREADWAICLARTDPAAPKHRGLTFFLVDMASAGIDIRPLREITGRAVFNEVFLDGVFVPGDCVVGRPGDGWRITRSALATERVAMGRGSALGDELERLIGAVHAAGLSGDPRVRDRLGGLIADGLAGSLLDLRATLARLAGREPGPEAAVRKLIGVAHRQAVAETALALCGPEGAAADGAAAGAVHEFLLTRCLSIAGGTTQILLSLVAERALGLPREPDREKVR